MSGRRLSSNAAGVLTIDLYGARLELARPGAPRGARALRRRDQGQRLRHRHRNRGAGAPRRGLPVFFVAHPAEGRARARRAARRVRGSTSSTAWRRRPIPADYAAPNLAPVIGSSAELARWAAFARGPAPPSALHLDTGMNRLGFASLARAASRRSRHGAAGADLLMSHFVSSEEPDNPLNAEQIARFDAARAALPDLPASLANSSGMFLASARSTISRARATRSMAAIRRPARPIRCAPSSSWKSRFSRRAGSSRARRAATTSNGPRAAARGSRRCSPATPTDCRAAPAAMDAKGREVAIAGRRCKLVGRVSMDLCIADVTDLPEDAARPAVRAQFFGPDIALDDFAARSGTIGYHVLTSLGARFARRSLPSISARFHRAPAPAGAGDEGLGARETLAFDDGNAVAAFLAQRLGERQIPLAVGRGAIRQQAWLRERGDLARRGARPPARAVPSATTRLARPNRSASRAPTGAAGQDHVERAAHADDARQAHRAAVDQRHAPAAAEHAEDRALLGDAQVAPAARARARRRPRSPRPRRSAASTAPCASAPSARRRPWIEHVRALGSPIAARSAPAQNLPARRAAPRRAARRRPRTPRTPRAAPSPSARRPRCASPAGDQDGRRPGRRFRRRMCGMRGHGLESSSANGSPSKTSVAAADRPRSPRSSRPARPSARVGERDEAGVGRRGRRGRAQGAAAISCSSRCGASSAGGDIGRGGRARDAREAMDQHRLARGPSRARRRAARRRGVVGQHLPGRVLDDVGHRDVEVALGGDRRRARTTGVPGLSSVTSERAPVPSTTSSIRASEQTCSRGMAASFERQGARRVRAKRARKRACASLGPQRLRDTPRSSAEATFGAPKNLRASATREAGELRRLEIGGFPVGRLDRLGERRAPSPAGRPKRMKIAAEQPLLHRLVVAADRRLERRDHVADHIFRRVVQQRGERARGAARPARPRRTAPRPAANAARPRRSPARASGRSSARRGPGRGRCRRSRRRAGRGRSGRAGGPTACAARRAAALLTMARLAPSAAQAAWRWQSTRWSLTMPTACMKA